MPPSTLLQMRFLQKDATIIKHDIPTAYKSYLYPFSSAALEESDAVDVLHQVMHLNGFTICNHIFFAKKDTEIFPSVDESLSTLHCMLQGSIKCELAGVGVVWLRAGQFGFFQVSNAHHSAWLHKGCIYESFHIDFSREQLQAVAPYSDIIQELMRTSQENVSAYVTPRAGIMFNRFYELITDIRNMAPTHKMREIEVPANISLLLAISLMDAETTVPPADQEEMLFATIHAYVQNNLARELSNVEIAREYSMSVSRLKYGYKRIHREPLQVFVRRARLERAKEMIGRTHLPLQRIAEMVGFPDYGHFSKSYKRFYGHPPSEEGRGN